ncbi:hypothetical protein GCK72_006630 [Caenorhabditis remanei]|uniref:Uncharacterized protein n=1 Tax=Caenorhabditis remanei TaxID=31234 RepID=A0A6A5HLB6_CAERE|nr:hypothetical protein GCK72_006630 [Caenorhabditis remanei]KAF1766672.1 hypothetical protein GCK72_006630 [Caenorhabditis remanei]
MYENLYTLQFSLESCLDILLHVLWLGGWRVSLDDVSVSADEELGEVPLDSIDQESSFLLLQELVQWVRIVSVDIDLLEKSWLKLELVSDESCDVDLARWFLASELVAWEGEDLESVLLVTEIEQ